MFLFIGCPSAKNSNPSLEIRETYVDEKYAVHIVAGHILSKKEMSDGANVKKWRNGYNEMSSNPDVMKEGMQMSNDSSPFKVDIKQFLHVPNKPIASFLGNGKTNTKNQNIYVINVSHLAEDSRSTNITFGSETAFPSGQKAFLSSPVAQRAFKKAGITLDKNQIDSMVEIK